MAANQRVAQTGQWRAVLQRGFDSAYRFSDLLAQRVSAALDPRARMLRQRRRALRWGVIFGAGCAFWGLVTAVLASWSTPWWVLLITGTSERGLFSLVGVLERGTMLPAGEMRDLTEVANRTAATMAATAAEVVSMEQTLTYSPDSRSYLVPTIDAFTAQLSSGVGQYNEMVTAAAQLVASVNSGSESISPMSQQRHREELVDATDRLLGWAQAFDELGRLPRV